MLARNSEVKGAVSSVRSVQEQFNDNFGYPWVFLNDEEWSKDFKQKVSRAVGKNADVKFEVVPKEMWGYPEWIDQERARSSMQDMKNRGIQYGGQESYHHMCRFQSGYVTHPKPLSKTAHSTNNFTASSTATQPYFPTNTTGASNPLYPLHAP
jgi:mannosyltransferase